MKEKAFTETADCYKSDKVKTGELLIKDYVKNKAIGQELPISCPE